MAPKVEWKRDPVREAQAVAALRSSYAATIGDDEDLLLDMVEGETDFLEILDRMILETVETQALIVGVTQAMETLGARKARFAKRVETTKSLIEQAMVVAEIPKLERPAATLSIARRKPTLIVTEESEIPAEFWKVGDPTLDRKALQQALQARAEALADRADDSDAVVPSEIPGATLSNGSMSLTMRVR